MRHVKRKGGSYTYRVDPEQDTRHWWLIYRNDNITFYFLEAIVKVGTIHAQYVWFSKATKFYPKEILFPFDVNTVLSIKYIYEESLDFHYTVEDEQFVRWCNMWVEDFLNYPITNEHYPVAKAIEYLAKSEGIEKKL